MTVAQMHRSIVELSQQKASGRRNLKQQAVMQNVESGSDKNEVVALNGNGFNSPMSKPDSTPSSSRFSWIKCCSDLIFKHTPDKAQMKPEERSLISDHADGCLTLAGRKRKVDNIPSNGTKNSRQKKDASVTAEDCTLCANSIEPNTVLDQPALMSYKQIQGGADESNVLIVDRAVDISEVAVVYVKKL
ncbi:uncharacterized protein LOC120122451 [Hibiscus syriacus]|uniref:uncharacterized protein LOC120122451 n=1 Tax=Hibiscus syriacus TaxID=106335 RepID=UPI001923D151|nr:uncharacterized protein LOC120122451 [Hibiscus syriacus]XP_038997518.1 uncharacterized protein LOC120122451 [Hibiscus syriacus]